MSDSFPYKSGGALIKLAPDLLALERRAQANMYESDNVTMVAGVENEILTLTGKYAVSFLELRSLVLESMTVRMEVNGTPIWNSTKTLTASNWSLHNALIDQNFLPAFQVNSSFSLFLTTTSDTSIDLFHTETKTL